MTLPFITALINSYNYGRFVEDAIHGALNQTLPAADYEVLVVDDGSTDDTPERVKRFGGRIHYLRKENGGQASAFNFGFQRARGEVIALLDADDIWMPEKLERIAVAHEKNKEAGQVATNFLLWNMETGRSTPANFAAHSGNVTRSRADLLSYAIHPTSCLSFRKTVLDKLLPVPESLETQADCYLTALIIFLAPVVTLSEPLTKYRIHGQNLGSYFLPPPSADRLRYRMRMRSNAISSMRSWLSHNSHDPDSPLLRDYFQQWSLAQELDGFALQSPSRFQFFSYLFRSHRIYSEGMSSGQRNMSRLRTAAGLVLGHRHMNLFDRWQQNR